MQELEAYQLLTVGLSFLQTSAECEAAVRPFLCLYPFSLCGSGSGQVYQPSFTECVTLMTKTCAREWQVAINTQLDIKPSCLAVNHFQMITLDQRYVII